ncbi:MAG: HYR domain-containing protein, partial [Dehalococcoidia bacterium]
LVVVLDLVPDGAIDVPFDSPGGDFSLDDDDDPALPASRSFPLAAGSYVVRQDAFLTGYEVSTICTDPDGGTVIFAANGATVDLDAGETVTCTFTNRVDSTPPALTLPATIVVDATSPAGATVTYTAFATDLGDPSPTVACLPVSGSVFPAGSTTVNCTATDGADNSTSGSFVVRVRGAGEQITALTAKTLAFVDRPALEAALKATLTTAANALAAGRTPAACAALTAYRSFVSAAPAGSLTPAEKSELIADATRIRQAIGCGSV